MDSTQKIIQNIRDYFELCRYSLTEVSEKMGISSPTLSISLSTSNPHKITNKSALRFCTNFPFNQHYLTTGEGSLLVADTQNSDFEDRRNWAIVDYNIACKRIERELKFARLNKNFIDMMSALFIDKEKEEFAAYYESCLASFTSDMEDEDFDWHKCKLSEEELSLSMEEWNDKIDQLLLALRKFDRFRKKQTTICQLLPDYTKQYLKDILGN